MDELAELKKQLEEGLASGKIKKDTEEYFELLKKIQEVENEIDNLDASIIEFSNNLSEQYRKIFDSLANEFEAKLGQISHYGNMLNNSLSITEEKGYMISEKYYEAMRANEYERMAMLREEREQLEKENRIAAGEKINGRNPKPIQSNLVYDIYNYALNKGVVTEYEYCTALNIKPNDISKVFYEGSH